MNHFAICHAGNGNPPPTTKPKRSEAPADQPDETPAVPTEEPK